MKPIHTSVSLLLLFLSSTAHMQAQQVSISPGLYVTATGAPNLVFRNLGLTNNGYFKAAGSTVTFTDSANIRPVLINGSSNTTFYQLAINQDVQLEHNIAVTGNLYLNSGNLQLDHYTLDLAHSGNIIGERNGSRIIARQQGAITRTALLYAPQQVNPGNIGVSITSTANLGETVITRGHQSLVQGSATATTNRYFDIAPAFNKNLNASLQFHYLDAELTGDENELTLFTTDGYGWKPAGKDNSNPSGNWLIKNKLDQLHRYTLAANTASPAMQVYPNPVRDKFTLTLPATTSGELELSLLDQRGRLVERKKITTREGVNNIEWNIGRHPAGNYHLVLKGAQTSTVKIIKE